MVRCPALKRLSIVLGSVGLLAGCGQLLGLGDYEVGGDGGTTTTGGAGGSAGAGGSGGASAGGSGGASGGGSGGTSGGGSAGEGGSTTTRGTGGSAGSGECECEQRDPCMSSECEDGQCVESPQPVGTKCLSGNFSGVCDEQQECVPCVDDASDTETDSGCPETAPECDDSGDVPECTGCMVDLDCDDGIECTSDTCDDGRCIRSVLPAGAECDFGVCNGEGAADSCVACIDNRATGVDAGCDAALPLCDATQMPATCVECVVGKDCDDDNECTTEACSENNECVFQTVAAGEACAGGVCSGVVGSEACGTCLDTVPDDGVDQGCSADAPICDMAQVPPACTGCADDTDCDDGIACTTDTCNSSQVCVHTPDDGMCAASGDVCLPNQCVPGTGCMPVDVKQQVQLLANGSLDSGGSAWTQESTNGYDVIVVEDYAVAAHTPTRYAWLGGAWYELSELSQIVSLPEGTQSVEFSFYYQLSTDDPFGLLPDDYNTAGAAILSSDGQTLLALVLDLGNQDVTNAWTEVSVNLDATAWAGSDVQVYFWATVYGEYYYYYDYTDYYFGNTNFRVDTISLIADVCQ